MKRWAVVLLSFLLLLVMAGVFVYGVYVGNTPYRKWIANTGGVTSRISSDLGLSAIYFGSPDGQVYDSGEVIKSVVQVADLNSVIAAGFYCQMSGLQRQHARAAASKLATSPQVRKYADKQGQMARHKLQTMQCPDDAR